jgi:hypothetical protein
MEGEMTYPWVLSVLMACFAAGSVDAVTISFQNGVGGYAGADHQSFDFDGTSAEDVIEVDLPNMTQPAGRYAWISFEDIVGAGAIPTNAVLSSAALEGSVDNPFGSATLARLLDGIANRPVSPAEIDDPGVAGAFYEDAAAELASASHGACASDSLCDPPVPIAWDVTAIVQAWVNGATNFGFLMLPETTNGGSIEGTDVSTVSLRPRLVVSFVPEPHGLVLLALGGLLAARGRPAHRLP